MASLNDKLAQMDADEATYEAEIAERRERIEHLESVLRGLRAKREELLSGRAS